MFQKPSPPGVSETLATRYFDRASGGSQRIRAVWFTRLAVSIVFGMSLCNPAGAEIQNIQTRYSGKIQPASTGISVHGASKDPES